MKKKYFWLAMVTTFLFLSITTSSWAITQLHLLLGTNGVLYKMTCTGISCTSWASIPGGFQKTPTIVWDEYLGYYTSIGLGTDGLLYRGTFTNAGVFNNDWTYISGGTLQPIATASGDLFESHLWTASRTATTTIGTSCTNYTSVNVIPPADGHVYVDGDLIVRLNHTIGTSDFGYVYVGTTPTDCTSSFYSEVVIPSEDPTTSGDRIAVHVGEGFSVIGGASYTYYLNAYMSIGGDSSDDFMDGHMKAVFYPD